MRIRTCKILASTVSFLAASAHSEDLSIDAAVEQDRQQLSARAEAGEGAVSESDGERVRGRRSIEEVIVTAQKREERIQDVPTSITVVSGKELERTSPQSLADMSGYFPGLTVNSGGSPGQANLTLRGIATGGEITGALVGTYVDEAPVGSSTAQVRGSVYSPDLMPYDLERIELLSGPQGTLYGAGSMGGLLKYNLKEAALDEFSARVGAVVNFIEHSDDPGTGARLAVNVPVVDDVFAVRLSGYSQKTQGYITNLGLNDKAYNSYTQQGGRIAGLWSITDDLSVKFSAMISNTDSDGPTKVLVNAQTLQPVYGELITTTATAESFEQDMQLYSLVANWELGFASLVSASSYEKTDVDVVQDLTEPWRPLVSFFTNGAYNDSVVPFIASRNLEKFTQEVRLASSSNQRFEWLLGAFYTHEDSLNFQPVYALDASGKKIPDINPFFEGIIPWVYQEIAGFANGTFHINQRFAVAGGIRYASNRQHNDFTVYGGIFGPGGTVPPATPERFSSEEGVVTWMVSPQWHLSREVMIYGRVATGYRPGGWSFASPPAPPAFRADTLINYELGTKASLLENRLGINVSIYQIDWNDIQQDVQDPVTTLLSLGNGDTARSRGIELAATYLLGDNLRLSTTIGYTDAKLTADSPGLGGLDGDRLPLSADFNGALTLDYQRVMSQGIELEIGAAYRYTGGVWTAAESSSVAMKVQKADPADFYVGIGFSRVDARLVVRNAFNSKSGIDFLRDPRIAGRSYIPETPRTIGLSVDLSF